MENNKFVSYILQDGSAYTGYVLETEGSQILLLAITGKELTFRPFSKSALKETVEHRLLTELEMELVKDYKNSAKEAGRIEAQIRQMQSDKDKNVRMQIEIIQKLSHFIHSEEKQGLNILTVSCLEENFSKVGYKNLFSLVRHGLVTLGERDEFFITSTTGKLTPLIEKQKGKVLEILNESAPDKSPKSLQLFKLATEADNERLLFHHKTHTPLMKEAPINEDKEKEEEGHSQGSGLNYLSLQDKLNETGFRNLKILQEHGKIRIQSDGTILFKGLESVPYLQPLLQNEELFVDVLNEPLPNFNVPVPIEELFKEFKTQIPQLVPELDKIIRSLIKK